MNINITDKKAIMIANLADQVALRPRTACEDMRRAEDSFADLIDSMKSKEFKKFQKEVESLEDYELIDLVSLIFIGKGEFDSYEDAKSFLSKNLPKYDYIISDVLRISFFIARGLSIIKNSHSPTV